MRNKEALALALLIAAATPATAGSLSFIEGKWNNQGGDDIDIAPGQLGGWDAFLGAVGQGNISLSTYKGSNIKVEAKNMTCFFRASVLAGGQQMNWQLRSSQGDCSSLEGYFTRL